MDLNDVFAALVPFVPIVQTVIVVSVALAIARAVVAFFRGVDDV